MSLDPATVAAYEKSRPLAGKPFRAACYAPYTSLYFNTNGDVIACCKNTTYVLGNVAHERLDDIWRGKKAEAMRKAMKSYKLGVGCDVCEWQIKGGQYDQVYATIFDELPIRDDNAQWPAQMEFTVSNTCNLACIMCYGVLSSTIRAHREKLPPLPKVYDDTFFADLRKYLPHLATAKFYGGEPFLAQENYRIWDMMIEERIDIPIHVTTNGTQWNSKVERVLEALPCSIAVSVDGTTKATVESIRVNANFEEVRTNVDRFAAYALRRRTAFSLTYCLMQQNWHEFGEYIRYGEARNVSVFINTVIDPPECSLYTLPPQELEAIAQKMDEMDRREGYSKAKRNGHVWTSAVQGLHKNADERQRQGIAEWKQARVEQDPIGAAWQLVNEGRFEEALRRVAGITPDQQQHFLRIALEGHVLRRMKRFDEAAKKLDEAIALYKRSPNAYVERAWLALEQHRPADALADAKQAVQLVGGVTDRIMIAAAYAVLGNAQGHNGLYDEALASLDQAVAILPDDTWMHVQRAWVLYGAKRFPEALSACARSLELKPDNEEAARLRELVTNAAR